MWVHLTTIRRPVRGFSFPVDDEMYVEDGEGLWRVRLAPEVELRLLRPDEASALIDPLRGSLRIGDQNV